MPDDATAGELWLLEAAVHFRIHLSLLAGGPEVVGRCLNFPDHGMTRAEVLDALALFAERGEIAAPGRAGDERPLTRDEIDRALVPLPPGLAVHRPDEVSYTLTAAGGARWERLAGPDWGRFFRSDWEGPAGVDRLPGDLRAVIAGSRERLDEVIAGFELLGHGEPVAAGPVAVIGPWEATYWKTLPVGYRAWVVTRETSPVVMSHPVDAPVYWRDWAERQRQFCRWTRSRWALHG